MPRNAERAAVAAAGSRGRGRRPPAPGLTPLQRTVLDLQRTAGNGVARSYVRRRLARMPRLPGYSQAGDTCGAASMVTAVFLWDIERGRADNAAVVHACDLVLTAKDTNGANANGKRFVQEVRARATTPGRVLGEADYQLLSAGLALLFNGRAGMQSSDIHALAKAIGFAPSGYGRGETLAQLLASDAVRDLKPGEVGQLNWVLRTGSGHAMLLGRHEDGTWFFSDQGPVPAVGYQRASHADLVAAVVAYAGREDWLYPGNKQDLRTLPPSTGFTALGPVQGFLNRGPALLVPGEELAEIDAGVATTGEVVTAWDYHSRHETLADAKDAIAKDTGRHGGVILERPRGMFHVWKTNPIKDAGNLGQTAIDVSDSARMVLVARASTFFSAWLVLSDPAGGKRPPIAVKP
jgi:hypothetical protein